jgi:hypothetical protein
VAAGQIIRTCPGTPFIGIITILISTYGCGDGDDRFSGVSVLDGAGKGTISVPWRQSCQFIPAKLLSYMAGIESEGFI